MKNLKILLYVAAALSAVQGINAAAADYPEKEISIIVPVAAGSTTDVVTRLVANHMAEKLGKPVVVVNRPGAETQIGMGLVAAAPPDGYTLGAISTYIAANNKVMKPDLAYDPKTAFVYIRGMGQGSPVIGVTTKQDIKSIADLIKYTAENKDTANYATGTTTSVVTKALLREATGIDATTIPFNGNAGAVQAVARGDATYVITTYQAMQSFVDSGQIKVIAVFGAERLSSLPDVPSMPEAGYDIDYSGYYGFAAPAGTPDAIVAKLSDAIAYGSSQPDTLKVMEAGGLSLDKATHEQFSKSVMDSIETFERIAKEVGLAPK